MNPELKQKWLAALRSGEYKQARGYLKTEFGYCCLGVLCDVSGLGEFTPVPGGVFKFEAPSFESCEGSPSTTAQHALEIDAYKLVDPALVRAAYAKHDREVPESIDWCIRDGMNVMGLNDNGVPFDIIADIVEAIY
jgi:hypothetical protein